MAYSITQEVWYSQAGEQCASRVDAVLADAHAEIGDFVARYRDKGDQEYTIITDFLNNYARDLAPILKRYEVAARALDNED